MFDAAPILDTYVTDDPDAERTETISIPRVATAELTMQVAVLGVWHRRTPDLSSTACGILYHSQFAPTRREELCNPLCHECFTKHERSMADARDDKENG